MSPSVAILCRQESAYADMVVEAAIRAGLPLTGVVVQQWGRADKSRRLRQYARKYGLAAVLATKMIEMLDGRLLARHGLAKITPAEDAAAAADIPVFRVPTLNGQETLDCLDRLRPDILLLAGVAIVSPKVIQRANRAVLNAHPGIVPHYRGNYVVRWALLAGDPVGITVHVVDAGVDTGAVLSITPVEVPRMRSLVAVENQIEGVRARLLVSECGRFLAGEASPEAQPPAAERPQYTMMPPRQLLSTYRALWASRSKAER